MVYRRMNYTDAIQYLKEHNIMKEDGSSFEFGDVSTWCHCVVFGVSTCIIVCCPSVGHTRSP